MVGAYAPMSQIEFFVSCVKKAKKKSRATPILAPNFIFFTHNTKMLFSHETTL
jgi:hypothetical protein